MTIKDDTTQLTDDELLTAASCVQVQAFALLEKYPGDATFQERATILMHLSNKLNAIWHARHP